MKKNQAIVKYLSLAFILSFFTTSQAQYQMEKLNRGMVAVRTGSNNFISWRWLGTEEDNITFNLYRDGTKVNSSPLTVCNYTDNGASATATYLVKAVLNNIEQGSSEVVTPWAQQYLKVPISAPAGGTTPDGVAYTYTANDASVADLDGDGIYEIILKWDPTNSKDNANSGYTGNTYVDAYKLNGTRMWRIDFGRNIRSGAHYLDLMVYDFDGDGKAEMMARTADGTKDGTGVVIGSATADYRNSGGYILSGPEFITVFNGLTGKAMATRDLYPPRGTVGDWGDTYGNRVDRFRACVAYLDGKRPSAVFVRGYYAKWGCEALDWRDGKFTQRWTYMCVNDPNATCFSEGNHNLSVADVDDDGKQEVIMGSNILDDNGTMYYNTNIGHGDALHVSDMDPSQPGLEVFNIQEPVGDAGVYMYSAKSKKILWKKASVAGSDEGPGRGVCADISSKWAGAEAWVVGGGISGELMDCKGNFVSGQPTSGGSGVTCNFLLWWNGDLQREMLDDSRIDNYDLGRITILGSQVSLASNNSSKKNPCLSGDLIGDWREEVIFRGSDNTALYLFTTTIPTTYKFRTLLHDPQYRMAIAWQNTGYNQPPHPSFYLGDGGTTIPKPNITIVCQTVAAPAVNNVIYCQGATAVPLTATASASGNLYWYGTSAAGGTASVVAPTPNTTTAGTTIYYVLQENGGCFSERAAITVTVNAQSKWYADTDSDGKGDPNTSQTVCTQPTGYVADNTDLCPADANKVQPGDCGCGKAETSCKDCNNTIGGTAVLDNCDRCAGGTTGKTACVSVGEAEADACTFEGITETKNAGFKGTSYLNVNNAIGTSVTFSVLASDAGTATLSFRYANGGTLDRPAQIAVNGTVFPNNLSFPVTGTFTDWKTADISLTLTKGINTVRLSSATAEGLANIDQIGYVSAGLSKGSCVITGITETNENQVVSIYPNPSKSNFHIRVSKAVNMQVTDVEGRLCEVHKNVSDAEFGENLKPGVYFLKIENKLYKLVKE